MITGKKSIPQKQELKLSDAFYEKDGSKLELVVKVKNCSDYMNLPVSNNCDILREYCRFIEIVEQTYSRHFPKRSIRRAIEIAKDKGILSEYLDRKSREVINMLCAKYDYKMDIAVKQEEARAEGKQAGILEGQQKKAVEDAERAIKLGLTVEQVAAITSLPEDKILELKEMIEN